MKKSQWFPNSLSSRQAFVFALIALVIIANTSWLVVSRMKAEFQQSALNAQVTLTEFQLFSQNQINHLQRQPLQPIELINEIYRSLNQKYPIQDIFLISNDGTYYSLNAGNPAFNLIVTEDDTDYASTPKNLANTKMWLSYYSGLTEARPNFWPIEEDSDSVLASYWLTRPQQTQNWLVALQITPKEFVKELNQTLTLNFSSQPLERTLTNYYQFPLNEQWRLSAPWHLPWLYFISLLLILIPVYLILIKQSNNKDNQLAKGDFREFIYDELNVLVFETNLNSEVQWVNGLLSNSATLMNVGVGDQIKKRLKPYPRYLTYWQHAVNGERLTFELEEYEHCLRVHLWPVTDEAGSPKGIGVLVHDISELKNIEKQLQHQQFHDDITGLPNRLFFIEQLQYILFKAKRKQEFIAVLALEINGLEHVNKLHGHDTTDLLLKQVIHEVQGTLRSEDIFCRFSDDEFLIGCDEYHHPEQLSVIAERLIQSTTQPFSVNNNTLRLSANVGIATFPRDARDAGSLISNAITAMRHARQTGRNSLDYFSADNARIAHDQWQLEQDINKALNAHDFTVHYQPIFLLDSNQCIGAEALIRWPSSNLSPDQFIPLAEETGLIHSIGFWVIETALKQFHDWRKAGSKIEYISINLSALQLADAQFLQKLDVMLATYPITPGQMTLEITESVMMQSSQATVKKLEALRERGFNLAIDDFGTGFSSLNYLKHLPVDYLKMDRSFVNGLPDNSDDQVICEAIIQLAVAMGLHIIAEGVETPAQMKWLHSHGVQSAQGYFFARAVPASEFATYLDKH